MHWKISLIKVIKFICFSLIFSEVEIEKPQNDYMSNIVKFSEFNFFANKKSIMRANQAFEIEFSEKMMKLILQGEKKVEMKALIFISVKPILF